MNTTAEPNLTEKLADIFKELAIEDQCKIIDFAEFLRKKERKKHRAAEAENERIADLNKDEI